MKLRKDWEVIKKTFGKLDNFVSSDGSIGISSNETHYIYNGDLNHYIGKIPLSLKPEANKVTNDFIEDLKQAISIRVSNKIANYDSAEFDRVMKNTNNKYDSFKKEIRSAIKEVAISYKRKGYDFESDPRFSNSYIFNDRMHNFVSAISQNCKLFFEQEKDQYQVNVSHFRDTSNFEKKKIEHFKALTRKKLDELIPSTDLLNWVMNKKAFIGKGKYDLLYGSKDIYQTNVTKKVSNRKIKGVELRNVFRTNPEFKSLVEEISKETDCNVILVEAKEKENNTAFGDFIKSFKKENGTVTFSKFGDFKKDVYVYKDKHLYKNDVCLGKFKFHEYDNDINKKQIIVFLQQDL